MATLPSRRQQYRNGEDLVYENGDHNDLFTVKYYVAYMLLLWTDIGTSDIRWD